MDVDPRALVISVDKDAQEDTATGMLSGEDGVRPGSQRIQVTSARQGREDF